ncbi:Mov34/MPN/PAD-1 family protein [Aliarcobacter butzleri]
MCKYWKIQLDKNKSVKISKKLIDELALFRQLKENDKESGGVLIGSFLVNGTGYILDKLTTPQSQDKQTQCSFFRSSQHNELVQKIWKETNGFSTYLGLWHSHPEDIPSYSFQDKKDWIDSLNESTFEREYLFFIILGRTHLRCWVGTKGFFFKNIKLIGEYKYD